MKKNIADLYGYVSKVTKFDVKFKRKRYLEACKKITDYMSNSCFPFGQISFICQGNVVVYGAKTLLMVDFDLFLSSNYEMFEDRLESFKNRLFRRFVESFFGVFVHSDTPLLNINMNFYDVLNVSAAKKTSRTDKIRDLLETTKEPLLIYGNSSSGKTISVAQAVSQLIVNSYACTWIDLVDVNVEIEHLVYSIFQTLSSAKHIIVIDNLQAYPSKIFWIKNVIDQINKLVNTINIKVVNVCWRSARSIVERIYFPTSIKGVECLGDDVIIELVRMASLDKYEREILSNSAGDVLVAKSMMDYILRFNRFPSEKQLSRMMYEGCTRKKELSIEAQNILYILASLGEFEIHVRKEYLQRISPAGFNELSVNNIFRTYETEDANIYVSIGHRSLAHKVLVYLRDELYDIKTPVEIAIEYLTIEGEKQILSTLERLDLELETGDSLFANLWRAFCNMRAALLKQLSVDPTWGNNMASMIFAAEALTNIKFDADSISMWKEVASNIRMRWCPDPNKGILFIGKSNNIPETTEIIDFTDNIRRTMNQDEAQYDYSETMLSYHIDYQRFHDNWLLGLLLGFEGLCLDGRDDLKIKYIASANKMQQANGSFYPERVCWVTARVIIGLSQCGLTFSDIVVKNACNWLVAQLVDKNLIKWEINSLDCCGWRSGTGTWNSNEQITLMCLCALFSAQYPIRKNQKVSKIIQEFWRCRKSLEKSFIEKGTILDIMWIIDVMLFDNRNPIDLKEEIKNLTDYVIDKWNEGSLLSSEKGTESSDVSFMAKELIFIVWALLKKNLKQLLKGLELDYSISSEKKKIFISYRREEGGGSAFAQDLYRTLNQSFKNEVFLDVYDLREESSEFSEILKNALNNSEVVVAIVTDHAFERACSSDYDNSKDVYYNELYQALLLNKKIITIYNSSIKRPELPNALKVNKDFYDIASRLSKKNATFYDSTIPNAMDMLAQEVIKKLEYLNI